MYVKSSIAKLSPAQMKKLHQGKSVRVQYGNGHEIPLPVKDHKKLMKAHSMGKGMVLTAPHLGGSLFSDSKDWYEKNIPPKYREPMERLVVAGLEDAGLPVQGAGMHGSSLFSDSKHWYEQNIPAKYRAPMEEIVKQAGIDAGLPIQGSGHKKKRGKGLFEDIIRGPSIEQAVALQNQLMRPPSIQQAVDLQNQLMRPPSIQQAVDLQNQLALYNPLVGARKPIRGRGKRRGKGLFEQITGLPTAEDLRTFPGAFPKAFAALPQVPGKFGDAFQKSFGYIGDHLKSGEPMRLADGRAPLSLQQWQKGDPFAMKAAGMHGQPRLAVMPYRRPMSGQGKRLVQKTLRGKGWKEDLEAFNAWTGDIGNKLTSVAHSFDPEGRLQEAGINALVDYIAPEAKAARIASQQMDALMGKPNAYRNKPKSEPKQEEEPKKKGKKKKKMPVVTAEIIDEEAPIATMIPMANLPPIPESYKYLDEDAGRAYQPVRWMGTGSKKATKPHMVKGSQAARDHMAKLRAMRMAKKGGALYPAGY